jgi:hypothetical protein
MRRWRISLVLLMSLWLPLQGIAAVVMPFCKHSLIAGTADLHQIHKAAANSDHSAHHGQHHGQPSDDSQGLGKNIASACDDCGHCNLSGACTLPAAELQTSFTAVMAVPYSIQPALAGVVPHHLKRPPLLA